MLANFTKGYLYVAGQKVGSEAFQLAAAYDADVAYCRVGRKKHLKLPEICEEFEALLGERLDIHRLLVIGTIREPVSWLLSWYNSRARPALSRSNHPNRANYTGDVPIGDFIEEAISSDPPQRARFTPQSAFYSGLDPFASNVRLLALEHQPRHFRDAPKLFDAKIPKFLERTRVNVSRQRITKPDDLSRGQKHTISDAFDEDAHLYRMAVTNDLKGVPVDHEYLSGLRQLLVAATGHPSNLFAWKETLLGQYTSEYAHGCLASAQDIESTLAREFPDEQTERVLAEQRRRYKL